MAQIKSHFARFPRSCVSSPAFTAKFLASLCLALLTAVSGAEAKKKPGASPAPSGSPGSPTAAASGTDAPADKDSGAADFDIPVPLNTPVHGIKIPHYSDDGRLTMMFDAQVATKLDASHIKMETLKIDAYSDDGKKMHIEMPTSLFNLDTRLLVGHDHVLVQRDDFTLTGDSGEFETKTRFAKIIGNVKMIIFNTQNLVK